MHKFTISSIGFKMRVRSLGAVMCLETMQLNQVCFFFRKKTTSCTAGRYISCLLSEAYVTLDTNYGNFCWRGGASWNNWLHSSERSWYCLLLWHSSYDTLLLTPSRECHAVFSAAKLVSVLAVLETKSTWISVVGGLVSQSISCGYCHGCKSFPQGETGGCFYCEDIRGNKSLSSS